MDSTLHKEVIGEFFMILGAKTGVLPKFQVKILKLPFSRDRLIGKKNLLSKVFHLPLFLTFLGRF